MRISYAEVQNIIQNFDILKVIWTWDVILWTRFQTNSTSIDVVWTWIDRRIFELRLIWKIISNFKLGLHWLFHFIRIITQSIDVHMLLFRLRLLWFRRRSSYFWNSNIILLSFIFVRKCTAYYRAQVRKGNLVNLS